MAGRLGEGCRHEGAADRLDGGTHGNNERRGKEVVGAGELGSTRAPRALTDAQEGWRS